MYKTHLNYTTQNAMLQVPASLKGDSGLIWTDWTLHISYIRDQSPAEEDEEEEEEEGGKKGGKEERGRIRLLGD